MKRLTDEELRRAEMNADTAKQFYARHGRLPGSAGLDVLDVVPALIAEVRELRALLATPMPCGFDGPRAFADGHVIRCDEVDCDDPGGMHGHGVGPRIVLRWFGGDPDDAVAVGAALIRAALAARGETK